VTLFLRASGFEHAPETIDTRYIAQLLAKDWGFWYTVTTNLKGLRKTTSDMPELNETDRGDIWSKVDKLLERTAVVHEGSLVKIAKDFEAQLKDWGGQYSMSEKEISAL